MTLPESLKKAEFCINLKHHYHNRNDEMLYGACNMVMASSVVASEWDKREKEHASFIEEIKKTLSGIKGSIGVMSKCSICDSTQAGLAVRHECKFVEYIVIKKKVFDAVFGGERK